MMASSRLLTALFVIAFARSTALVRLAKLPAPRDTMSFLPASELKAGKQQLPNKFGLCFKRAKLFSA
jgi:hypothetical protein